MSLDIHLPYSIEPTATQEAAAASVNSSSLDIHLPYYSQPDRRLHSQQPHSTTPLRRIYDRSRMKFSQFNVPDPRNLNIPHPREWRQKFQPQGASPILLLFWTLSAFVVFVAPLIKWSVERNQYYQYAGRYVEYNNQQRQYEQQQNGNNNNNNNINYYNLCGWWDYRCKAQMRQYQQNGQGGNNRDQNQIALPGWYYLFGGHAEEDERQREEMGMSSYDGTMKFVYSFTVIMFIGLSAYGFGRMYSGKERGSIIGALLVFGMFSLMNLLTTVQGTIDTDDRFFENSVYGWFGQWSVLVAYTDFFMVIHCFFFSLFLGVLMCLDKKAKKDVEAEENAEYNEDMGYNMQKDQTHEVA